jgi:hypothetical protein
MPQRRSIGEPGPSAMPQPLASPRIRRAPRDRSRRFALGFLVLITLVSLLLGWGLASLGQAAPSPAADQPRTVDYVPPQYQLGQRLYLQNCATCHIGVPPETLPSEAWRNLIQDSSHYGKTIPLLQEPSRGLIWTYLRTFSRLKSSQEEQVPYRLARSRYFKALHPDVALPQPLGLESCASCHSAAQQFSFRP